MSGAPVIFLDFDGPIRSHRTVLAGLESDPVAVAVLFGVLMDLEPLGVRLVVSSSWRCLGRAKCEELLDAVPAHPLSRWLHEHWCIPGISDQVAGASTMAQGRAGHIEAWCRSQQSDAGSALVVDDLPLRRFLQGPTCVSACAEQGMDAGELGALRDWARRVLARAQAEAWHSAGSRVSS